MRYNPTISEQQKYLAYKTPLNLEEGIHFLDILTEREE